MNPVDPICVNTLRFLAVDAVERARSGHPGMPLGAAPMAYVLWDRVLKHAPHNPGWFNRDRFILSAGHGSALLYALLHMTGYDLTLEDLKQFRQWASRTPGHPERGLTPGVEATTGPLGQGFAMGVGMAIAERFLAARFNRPDFPVVDHFTYAIVSDGDLMEGVASEAASLAGTLGLGKLIYLYDDNGVSIEGSTDLTFCEDVAARFAAYGWHVERVEDGNDVDAIEAALCRAQAERLRPSLVVVATHLGYGSPKQDAAEAHGEPLGPEAARATKAALGWPLEPPFLVPEEARAHMGEARERGRRWESEWRELVARYRRAHAEAADEFDKAVGGALPDGLMAALPAFNPAGGPIATREASGEIMNAIADRLPTLLGGSADLAPSTKTLLKGEAAASAASPGGRNFHFGVREHAMAAAANGMAVHGGVIPYASTFLVFSDYMRPALRFAAMMQTRTVFIFTHDSIALGEDGPTHQPVEQLMSLRAIPGLTVLRPADATETRAAWRVALERKRPVAILLTRQKVPVLEGVASRGEAGKGGTGMIEMGVARGAYTLREPADKPPDIIIVATGSEVHLALAASAALEQHGVGARIVSMPSWEIFEEQSARYRQDLLPLEIPKLAIEAGASIGWWKYVGEKGGVIGLDRFGASAPGGTVYANLGFSVDNVIQASLRLLGRSEPNEPGIRGGSGGNKGNQP